MYRSTLIYLALSLLLSACGSLPFLPTPTTAKTPKPPPKPTTVQTMPPTSTPATLPTPLIKSEASPPQSTTTNKCIKAGYLPATNNEIPIIYEEEIRGKFHYENGIIWAIDNKGNSVHEPQELSEEELLLISLTVLATEDRIVTQMILCENQLHYVQQTMTAQEWEVFKKEHLQ